MADLNIDRFAKQLILELIRLHKEGKLEVNYGMEFYKMARLIINNCGVGVAFQIVEQASEDLAHDLWKGKKFYPPKIKKSKNKLDPDVKKIKGQLTIIGVANKYGLEIVKGRSKCPFHKGDNNTSLSFNINKNIFNCFACGETGDIFTFIKKMEDVNDK